MKLMAWIQRWPMWAASAFVAVCATAAVQAPAATPATPAAPDSAEVRQQLDALLARRVDAAGPGVALLVARGDRVIYRGARGLASVELGVPLTTAASFRIGSVTKQFAAAVLLKHIDEGRATLADPLSKYLPDYPGGAGITLAQLLNHTSGVKSYTGIPGYMDQPIRRDLSTAELLAVFRDQPVDFAPGANWAYNNSGYVLVGAVIEAIGKKPWHEQVVAMLKALAITHTVYGDNRAVIAGMADGYSAGAEGRIERAGMLSMTQPHAAGALVSTVDDLLAWNLALHRGHVLSAESYRRMTTPEGEPAQKQRYGYGIGTGQLRGQALLVHGGGIHGFLSNLIWLPAQQITVVALRNSDGPGADPGALARSAAAIALGEPYPDGPTFAVPAAELRALAGRWKKADGSGDETLLRVADGALALQNAGGPPRKLRAIGGGRFLAERGMARVEFTPGRSDSARFFPDGEGEGEAWVRLGDLPAERAALTLTPAQQQALVGSYAGPQFAFKVFVDAQGVLRGQAQGQPALQLHAEAPRRLFVMEVDARFEFEPAEGPATSVTLKQGPATLKMARQP